MKLRHYFGWAFGGLFLLLGILIYFFLVGYSFSAYICFGIAAALCLYTTISLLAANHKRTAAILRLILSTCLAFGLIAAASTGLYIAKAAFAASQPNCQYVVILGAGLHGSTPSMTLSDRLNAAQAYLQDNPDTICIVSGGQGPGEDMTEAACMQQVLVNKGIDPSRIWIEDKSTSTFENLQFSLALIEANTGARPENLGILSSEYHVFRACQTAKKLGITPIGIPAETSYFSLFLNYFLREIPAVWYYTIIGG